MPMAPYTRVDFGNRIKVIRDVAVALTAPTFKIPAQGCANSDLHCLYWINALNASNSLGQLSNLDYTGFLRALNALVAKVP